MGADEILMEPFASALGPIDAQLRGFSVEALLTGVEKIKNEVVKTGKLNHTYVPFPAHNKFKCPSCGTEQDLSQLRQQVELQTKKKIIP